MYSYIPYIMYKLYRHIHILVLRPKANSSQKGCPRNPSYGVVERGQKRPLNGVQDIVMGTPPLRRSRPLLK